MYWLIHIPINVKKPSEIYNAVMLIVTGRAIIEIMTVKSSTNHPAKKTGQGIMLALIAVLISVSIAYHMIYGLEQGSSTCSSNSHSVQAL